MPVSIRVLPERYLVYVRYDGWLDIDESMQAFSGLQTHPDFRKGMRQLIDLAAATGWNRDYASLMKHKAMEAGLLSDPRYPTLVVCHAPTDFTRTLAHTVNRAWEDSQTVITVTVETEPEALDILGIDLPSFDALWCSI